MSEQKVILVTGASSGIGAAIAERLAGDGHRVFGTGRNADGKTAAGVELLPLDVCSEESVRTCVAAVLARAGHIDVLVNNAGYLLAGAIEDASIDQAKAQFETNFFGVVRMVKAVLPSMRERRTETLRMELKPFGIRVAMVEPGAIKTPFYAQPSATAMVEYSPWRERALKTMKGFEDKAPGPEVVAARVSRIVAKANPRLRNRVTREAGMFSFLRWLLPSGAFESGVRSGFHLDKENF
jgi:NAD(P)-dependent dehydrogenase (short-subunit alcohol dehydrogenase family)